MGIDMGVEEGWLKINETDNVVTLTTIGRSYLVIRQKMRAEGAVANQWYTLVFKGEVVGEVKAFDRDQFFAARNGEIAFVFLLLNLGEIVFMAGSEISMQQG